jgi:choline kinase
MEAVILAAGVGSRMAGSTGGMPKCMVRVAGRSILSRALATLDGAGIRRVTIVTGYESDALERHAVMHAGSLAIEFVHNAEYRSTNNCVSLWMLRSRPSEDFVLLESDLLFTAGTLASVMRPDAAAVCRLGPRMRGTVATVADDGRVARFILAGEARPAGPLYKTVNLYALRHRTWHDAVWPALDRVVRRNDLGDFYERAFALAIDEGTLSLRASICEPEAWCEVDTPDDLKEAERRF